MTQSWRSKKYHCVHLEKGNDQKRCSLAMCSSDDVFTCCASCPEYVGKDRGLGDTIKRITTAAGIKTCGKCQKRREALNKLTGKLFTGGSGHDSRP